LNNVLQGISCVAFDEAGKYLAAGTRNGSCGLWQLSSRNLVTPALPSPQAILPVGLSADGPRVGPAPPHQAVPLHPDPTGGALAQGAGDRGLVVALAFSPDGRMLASGTTSFIHLWEVATGKSRGGLTGHGESVLALAFSPDASVLASGGSDRRVRLWDLATGN